MIIFHKIKCRSEFNEKEEYVLKGDKKRVLVEYLPIQIQVNELLHR